MKPPAPSEKAIHKAVLQYLRTCSPVPVFVTTVEQGAPTQRERNRNAGMGVVAGFPDIMFFCDARAFAFEVKKEGGRTSKKQTEVQRQIRAAGSFAGVVRSVEDVCEVLDSYGVPLRARPVGMRKAAGASA